MTTLLVFNDDQIRVPTEWINQTYPYQTAKMLNEEDITEIPMGQDYTHGWEYYLNSILPWIYQDRPLERVNLDLLAQAANIADLMADQIANDRIILAIISNFPLDNARRCALFRKLTAPTIHQLLNQPTEGMIYGVKGEVVNVQIRGNTVTFNNQVTQQLPLPFDSQIVNNPRPAVVGQQQTVQEVYGPETQYQYFIGNQRIYESYQKTRFLFSENNQYFIPEDSSSIYDLTGNLILQHHYLKYPVHFTETNIIVIYPTTETCLLEIPLDLPNSIFVDQARIIFSYPVERITPFIQPDQNDQQLQLQIQELDRTIEGNFQTIFELEDSGAFSIADDYREQANQGRQQQQQLQEQYNTRMFTPILIERILFNPIPFDRREMQMEYDYAYSSAIDTLGRVIILLYHRNGLYYLRTQRYREFLDC